MELVTGDLKQIKTLTTLLLDSKSIRKKSCTKINSMHLLLQAVFVFKCTLKDKKLIISLDQDSMCVRWQAYKMGAAGQRVHQRELGSPGNVHLPHLCQDTDQHP